ncbi:hypothetical protein BGV40_04615 [Methanosarcina sp. Ant1]|nr:hypothetical protein BGV40_04615 [Methanosarcina sp. Ant1]
MFSEDSFYHFACSAKLAQLCMYEELDRHNETLIRDLRRSARIARIKRTLRICIAIHATAHFPQMSFQFSQFFLLSFFLETALLIQAYVFEISYTFDFVPSLKASNLYSGSFS